MLKTASIALLAAVYCTSVVADDANAVTDNATVAATGLVGGMLMADKILVQKSERRLYLLRQGQVLRSYRVALGLRPDGRKEHEGDYRTPEGEYKLIRRNSRSDFFLSMEISYPNSSDLAHAQRHGLKPGGAIMLHGWPNVPHRTTEYYRSADWTDGCIAVANSDMVEIWLMTPIDTSIEIRP
jgi:murein L,D-transpeptidase YafK